MAKSGAVAKMMTRSKLMAHHVDPLDAVERFVRDEFKYNTRLISEEITGIQEDAGYDASFLSNVTEVLDFSEYSNDQQNVQVVRFFHGTDLNSAADILLHGIKVIRGKPKRDFSDGTGFYLIDNYEHSKTWAFGQTDKPAVLELKVPKTCLTKACGLDLTTEQEWREIVTENRSGRPSKKLRKRLERYDFIKGPISAPRRRSSDERSAEISREPKRNSCQICVVNEDFAQEVGRRAKYTLYTSK
jgi:hypothetical protein